MPLSALFVLPCLALFACSVPFTDELGFSGDDKIDDQKMTPVEAAQVLRDARAAHRPASLEGFALRSRFSDWHMNQPDGGIQQRTPIASVELLDKGMEDLISAFERGEFPRVPPGIKVNVNAFHPGPDPGWVVHVSWERKDDPAPGQYTDCFIQFDARNGVENKHFNVMVGETGLLESERNKQPDEDGTTRTTIMFMTSRSVDARPPGSW